MRRPLLPVFLCLVALPAVSQPPLDLDAVEARSRPDAELASRLQLLARGGLLTASTGGFAREGPTLSVEAGPRSAGGATTSDLAAGIELPIVLDPGPVRRASGALRAGAAAIEVGARLEARQRLRAAFADAWLAGERAALLDEQVRLGEEWLRVTTRRIEEGAQAPYQARLVEGDLLRVRAERDRAIAERAAAWSALRERAALPAVPAPLLSPPFAVPSVPREASERFSNGVLVAGLAARETLEETSLELERSLVRERWSLTASIAKESDETVARAGLAYRFPLGGETAARDAEGIAAQVARSAAFAAERSALEARLASALARATAFGELPEPGPFAEAIAAVGLRLSEGKESPAAATQLRRQLVEATLLALERRRDAFLLADEIDVLTKGDAR